MIATLRYAPNWFFDDTNKPSLDTYQNWLEYSNNRGWYVSVKTLEPLELTTTKIQCSMNVVGVSRDDLPTMLEAKNGFIYHITNISLIQSPPPNSNNGVYQIDLELDVYLTFIVQYFNEGVNQNIGESVVFFKRKHVNRGTYNGTGEKTVLNFSKQFGLNSVDKDLLALINHKEVKNSYTKGVGLNNDVLAWTPDTNASPVTLVPNNNSAPLNILALSTTQNLDNTNFPGINTLEELDSFYNGGTNLYLYGYMLPSVADMALNQLAIFPGSSPKQVGSWLPLTTNNLNIGFYYGVVLANQNTYCGMVNCNIQQDDAPYNAQSYIGMPLYVFYAGIAKQTYHDIIALPFAWYEIQTDVVRGGTQANEGFLQVTNTIYTTSDEKLVTDYYTALYQLNSFSKQENFDKIFYNASQKYLMRYSQATSFWGNNVMRVGYDRSVEWLSGNINLQPPPVGKQAGYTDVIEPMLLNEKFYEWRIKLGNIEQKVFLSDFDNVQLYNQNNFLIGLRNFNVVVTYPNINIVNAMFNELNTLQAGAEGDIAKPYNINTEQNLLYNFEGRNTFPSESSNGTNYQEQNHNQYELGRNLSILNMASGVASTAMSIAPDFMMGAGAMESVTNSVSKMTSYSTSGMSYGKSNAKGALGGIGGLIGDAMNYAYKYGGGMKGDYNRVPDVQASGSMNPYLNNDMQVMWLEMGLVPWAQQLVSQRYMLNGYIIERYLPFRFGNNRKYCNYVEILHFSTILPQLPKVITEKVNEMFFKGIRVGNKVAFDNPEAFGMLNWGLGNQNFENYVASNEEIEAINGEPY